MTFYQELQLSWFKRIDQKDNRPEGKEKAHPNL